MQDHITSFMYSNFLHSLADHVPLITYKDTQAFMTLIGPTAFIFIVDFLWKCFFLAILCFYFPRDSYFRLHIKYVPTLHIWPVKSYHLHLYLNMKHTFWLPLILKVFVKFCDNWYINICLMLFSWLVKPCFHILIEISAGLKTAACLQGGNNRLNRVYSQIN